MKWKQISLGEILRVKHGWAFKSEHFSDVGQHIVLTPGNFYEEGGFKARGDKDRFYSGEYPSEYLLSKDNVIVAMTEQGEGLLGSTAIIPENDRYLHNQRLGLVTIKNDDEADLFFVYKLFNTQIVRQQISGSASGAKVKHTAPERIYKCKVELPPLHIQKKIASILSAYDDLIENNLKRINLLEEMAQITYEEWFVRLKFPGHETTPLDSATGLPVGWEKLSLNNLVDFVFGYPFNSSQFNTERIGMPIIRIRNIPDSSTTDFTTEIVDSKYIVNSGDLLVGMDGEFYINNWSSSPAYLVQRTCNIKPLNNRDMGFIREAIRVPIKFYESTISGATVAHLGKKHLDEIELIFPTQDADKLLPFFNELLAAKLNLANQNQLLKEARDILLPRLMTGMIDVEQLVLPEPFTNPSASTQEPQTV